MRKGMFSQVQFALLLVLFIPLSTFHNQGPELSGTSERGIGLLERTRNEICGSYFTENIGQWNNEARFVLRGAHGTTYFCRDSIIHDLWSKEGGNVIKVAFDHPDHTEPIGFCDLGFDSNYFLGNDPNQWMMGARSFMEVLYEDVWPGTDIRYYLIDGQLKYNIILGELSDPERVRFNVYGSSGLVVKDDGLKYMKGNEEILFESGLIAFYEGGGEVSVQFEIIDPRTYGFEIVKEAGRKLIIDPILFSTVIGGSSADTPTDFEMDDDGEFYIYGTAYSRDYPNTTGAYDNEPGGYGFYAGDLFVTKMDRECSSILFSTFIGGWTTDISDDMDIDENEDIYLTGYTYGWEFPTTPGAFQRDMNGGSSVIFVTKLAANGRALVFSTFVGGNTINVGCGITVRNGNACVCGHALGYNFPTHKGPMGGVHGYGVYFEMNHNGSEMVDYISIDGYLVEWLTEIDLDSNGDVIMAGYTSSAMIPTTSHSVQYRGSALVNSFIAKYKPDWGTFEFISEFGADMETYIKGLAIDHNDNIYFTGYTKTTGSQQYPTTLDSMNSYVNYSANLFITKLNPNGTCLLSSAVLGGMKSEVGAGVDIDSAGNIYIAGRAEDFIPVSGFEGSTSNGGEDAILLKVDRNCTKVLNLTFIGGSGPDKAIWCRLRNRGEVVIGGERGSPDFPITSQFNLSDTYGVFITGLILRSKPSEPIFPKAMEGDGSIVLEWKPPLDDGNSPILNYTVYKSLDPWNLSVLKVLNVTMGFIDTDIEYGTPHYYSVTATNSYGEGPFSSVVCNLSTILPLPPRDFRAVSDIGQNIITFDRPRYDGGSPITGYSLYRDDRRLVNLSTGMFEFNDPWIEKGTFYEYYATSWNKNGESGPCEPITIRSKTDPSPPMDLTCWSGPGFVDLRWWEPLDNGGLDIESYIVYKGTEPSNKTVISTIDFDSVTFRDLEVIAGLRYYYEVVARTRIGPSEPSKEVSILAVFDPAPPLNATAISEWKAIRIDWSLPDPIDGSVVLGVNIYEGVSINHMTLLSFSNGNSTCFVHRGLADDRIHYYALTAVTNWGESIMSPIFSQRPYLSPTPPTRVKAISSDGFVKIEWGAPDRTGNLPLKEYVLYRRENKGIIVDIARTEVTVSGYKDMTIERGVSYFYYVRASNGLALSEPSEEVSASGQYYPDPPSNLSVVPFGNAISVSWDRPSYDGGSPIRTYTIIRKDESGRRDIIDPLPPDILEFMDQTVPRGMGYTYYMMSSNDIGTSPLSGPVMVKLPVPPSVPKHLNASLMAGNVFLSWSVPSSDGGAPILYYNIYRRAENDSPVLLASSNYTARVFVDFEIEEGTVYTYHVTAVSSAGESGPSEQISIELGIESQSKGSSVDFWVLLAIISVILAVLILLAYLRNKSERKGDHGPVYQEEE